MTRQLGMPARIACLVLGVLLLGLFGALTPPWRYLTLVGLVPLAAGLGGQCPVCAISGRKGGE